MSPMEQPSRAESLQEAIAPDPGVSFPFRVELSLAPLVRFWNETFGDDRSAKAMVAAIIRKEIERIPELTGTIADAATLARHRKILDVVLAAVFPPAMREQEYGAAMVPCQLRAFYATPPCARLLLDAEGRLHGRVNLDRATIEAVRRFWAYALVLDRVYGIDVDIDHSAIVSVADPDTGLDRHFKLLFDWRFLDVDTVGPAPELPPSVRERLSARIVDPDVLPQVLPADRFVLRGFTVLKAIDVTDQVVLSSLQRDLIDKESIVSCARLNALQDKLRMLFRRPKLTFSVAAVEGDNVLMLHCGAQLVNACIFADSAHRKTKEFAGSVFERAGTSGRAVIVDDLAMFRRTPIEDELLALGVRSLVVAPLHYGDRVIGTLQLDSPNAGDLNATHLPTLHEVLPLFSMAVRRSLDELEARVQAVIKEKCTAIHPVVEWRFRRAVLDAIDRRRGGAADATVELEPIVFDGVKPLYGLSDIRGSSTRRALAIQADVLAQLRLAHDVLEAAYAARPLPAVDELRYRVDKRIAHVGRSLTSGDEQSVIAFLRGDVEPLFQNLATAGPEVRARIDAYHAAIDPRRGAVYAERQRFEQSVTRLTEAISSYLDLEEQAAQGMVPHYFEKQKTDGVDYQIYAGPSLLEDGRLDPLGLRNLRLWQLMVACGIALRGHQLRDTLPVPLDLTHLVLVQHTPLAIRFRFDLKRFDVDGAYDIRYEIVKKRIDKALVRGTTARVTQPGKIAIVYAQPAEAHEYRGYVEYLQHLGYLGPEVEDLELDELQGVYGLRALRVSVNLDNAVSDRLAAEDLQAARPV